MLYLVPILLLAALYATQDQLILQPGIGGKASIATAESSSPWLEQGKYRGKIHEPALPAKGTVVLYHGNAGTVDHRDVLAKALTSRGFRAVLVEYPGYGERDGRATVNSALSASLEDFALAHIRWPGPIYVAGESFGAGIAAQVVKSNPDKVAGVLLFTPWDSLANVVSAKFLHIPLGFLLHQRLDSVEALAGYQGNLAIVAAAEDTIIPTRHARALAKALPAASYVEIPGAGHNSWPLILAAEDWDKVLEGMSRGSYAAQPSKLCHSECNEESQTPAQ